VDLDDELRALAERQHGVLAREQARQLGASRHHLRRRVDSPDWEVVTPKVLRLVGSQRTFRQRCMAGALDGGPCAAVSYESAAALWRLPGFLPGPLHLSRSRGRSGRLSALAVVHQSCDLPDVHVRLIEGIPVTSIPRTMFDLAGALHPGRTERALDNALARRLTTVAALNEVTADLAARGRPGSAVMRRLLAERDASYVAPESNLEHRFESILRAAGVEIPLRQRDVGGAEWIGRADYLDPGRKLVVEIDSDIHHSTPADAGADGERDAAMTCAGYTVLRIKEFDLWHRPEEVVRRFLAA
jgi:very-short-patch-repair endonuclease